MSRLQKDCLRRALISIDESARHCIHEEEALTMLLNKKREAFKDNRPSEIMIGRRTGLPSTHCCGWSPGNAVNRTIQEHFLKS